MTTQSDNTSIDNKDPLPPSLQIAYTELQNCLLFAKTIKNEITQSKTTTKKKYLTKKLAKNNKYALQLLTFIDRYKATRAELTNNITPAV